MPGLSPRELKRLMKRMGIEIEELKDVEKVEIILHEKKIVVRNPQVIAMHSRGETIYQIIGKTTVEELGETPSREEVEVSEEDIDFIVSQTGVSREEAKRALIEANGDLAAAILKLQGG